MASADAVPLTAEDHAEVIECARYGELEDLKTLLELGCDVNYADAGGSTALHKAAANGSVDIARLLHSHGARYTANTSGNTPLHWACLNGHTPCVDLLLALYPDADVYAKNSFGRSAFTEALAGGHDEIGRLLLASPSADPAVQAGGGGGPGSGVAAPDGVVEEDEGEEEDEEGDLLAGGEGAEGEGAQGAPLEEHTEASG